MGNIFGTCFRIATFGESHGKGVGCIIDGCPPGLKILESEIQEELNRRRPGQSDITTPRDEKDQLEILSGVFENHTTGAPIMLLVRNKNQKSSDYDSLKNIFRPSHADFTYEKKFGIRDYRGGGRASARETIARVASGAIAKKFLEKQGITIKAFVSGVGRIHLDEKIAEIKLANIEKNIVRCPNLKKAKEMEKLILLAKRKGDSVGGVITCLVQNPPIGLGEPCFDKLDADLAKAMLSIPATKGFEIGDGFVASTKYGSENNDEFFSDKTGIHTKTNHSGGILGGISNGEDVYFRIAFKPTATISLPQKTINKQGENVNLEKIGGRHDPCVVPRAVPIVEAMTALVIMDRFLRNKTLCK
jgi:chorismate synthase